MSAAAEVDDTNTMMFCASCGEADGNDIKLMRCACKLVKYCGVKCQKDHRPQHKKECKKRVAELKDEILFKQPESSCFGDCPICCLPLPIDNKKSILYACCSKVICKGCVGANLKRVAEERLEPKCPFCRKAPPKTNEEENEQKRKRIEANDPVAICQMGAEKYHKGDYDSAFKYYSRAAVLGDMMAHFQLSRLYDEGTGVEKNEKKHVYHAEKAAIGGHPHARHNLGCTEERRGSFDRAANHYIIAAKLGDDGSLKRVKDLYQVGYVNKDDFTAALRGHKAAIDATKSPQREEAYAFYKKYIEGKV